MEYGSIEREIHVDASPEVVFEVEEHSEGWDYFIPRLGEYVARLVSSS